MHRGYALLWWSALVLRYRFPCILRPFGYYFSSVRAPRIWLIEVNVRYEAVNAVFENLGRWIMPTFLELMSAHTSLRLGPESLVAVKTQACGLLYVLIRTVGHAIDI